MPGLDPLPDLGTVSIDALARLVADRRPPPVESWAPGHCGDSGIRIGRDGNWFHEGRPIRRPEMVRLFSSILRREADGRFLLVTPAEMLDVEVEECPFLAIEVKSEGEARARRLAFRLNSGDVVIAGREHPLRIEAAEDGPRPRLLVRGRLEAAIARPVYYELAAMALAEDNEMPGLWSDGTFFPLDAA